MKDRCVEVEQIAEVLDLPAGDSRRLHLESCPRCRNLARSWSMFVRAEAGTGARPEAARKHLAAVILETSGTPGRPKTARARRWSFPHLRMAGLAAAAAAVAIAAVVLWQDRTPAPPVLRNDTAGTAAAFSLFPAEALTPGTVRLSWRSVPGAGSYQVRVYTSGLDEIYRHPSVTDTSIVIRPSGLPAAAGSPGLVWRVYALRGDDVTGISAPGSIPLP